MPKVHPNICEGIKNGQNKKKVNPQDRKEKKKPPHPSSQLPTPPGNVMVLP